MRISQFRKKFVPDRTESLNLVNLGTNDSKVEGSVELKLIGHRASSRNSGQYWRSGGTTTWGKNDINSEFSKILMQVMLFPAFLRMPKKWRTERGQQVGISRIFQNLIPINPSRSKSPSRSVSPNRPWISRDRRRIWRESSATTGLVAKEMSIPFIRQTCWMLATLGCVSRNCTARIEVGLGSTVKCVRLAQNTLPDLEDNVNLNLELQK